MTLPLSQPLVWTEDGMVMKTYKERNIKKLNNKDNQVNKDNDENVGLGFWEGKSLVRMWSGKKTMKTPHKNNQPPGRGTGAVAQPARARESIKDPS